MNATYTQDGMLQLSEELREAIDWKPGEQLRATFRNGRLLLDNGDEESGLRPTDEDDLEWVELLLNPPHAFEVPPRDQGEMRPLVDFSE